MALFSECVFACACVNAHALAYSLYGPHGIWFHPCRGISFILFEFLCSNDDFLPLSHQQPDFLPVNVMRYQKVTKCPSKWADNGINLGFSKLTDNKITFKTLKKCKHIYF